jgi:hypothetical protein
MEFGHSERTSAMQFHPEITELTTAASDVALALLGVGCALALRWRGRHDRWRSGVWAAALGLVAAGAALGAVAHGFRWSARTEMLLWQPLLLALGLAVAAFLVGVVYDLWGRRAAGRAVPAAALTAIGFYLLTLLVPIGFLLFALLQLVAMAFAALAYAGLAVRGRRADFGLVAGVMLLSVVAAIVQTQPAVSLMLVWPFDQNGVYHLIQMPGLVLLAAGLSGGFRGGPDERAARAERGSWRRRKAGPPANSWRIARVVVGYIGRKRESRWPRRERQDPAAKVPPSPADPREVPPC